VGCAEGDSAKGVVRSRNSPAAGRAVIMGSRGRAVRRKEPDVLNLNKRASDGEDCLGGGNSHWKTEKKNGLRKWVFAPYRHAL